MDVLDLSLDTLCAHETPNISRGINEVNSTEITYDRFFAQYLLENRPCLIKNVSSEWPCQKDWIKDGKPNFTLLKDRYGDAEVPVANCNERYFNSQCKNSMKMEEFLDYWENYIKQNHDPKAPCLYMKDWHYANANPEENVYRVPPFFASDWINEYLLLSKESDDYRFVYMGPKGSWTPLHADVFSSFSWSVNICGKKKWIFLPPGEEERFKDVHGNLAFDITEEDFNDVHRYPRYSPNSERIFFIQDVGDAIFVPTGWHHQVWNLDDTISINHNWVNGCNILKMWSALNDCYKAVCHEISDCQDMEGWDDQCQLVLKSCFGMNHNDFYRFVSFIAQSRINAVDSTLEVIDKYEIGRYHILFDLKKLKPLLETMHECDVPCYSKTNDEMSSVLRNIEAIIEI